MISLSLCPVINYVLVIFKMQAPTLAGGKGGKAGLVSGKGGKGAKIGIVGGKGGKGGKSSTGKAKKAPMSRSARAGLQFPVGRLH